MGQLSHYHSEAIKRHEAVVVTQEKTCDICQLKDGIAGVVATVDGKTIDGPWANMCDQCFEHYGIGLGLGKGQRLIVQAYDPDKKRGK
jgi:hypothetical protein